MSDNKPTLMAKLRDIRSAVADSLGIVQVLFEPRLWFVVSVVLGSALTLTANILEKLPWSVAATVGIMATGGLLFTGCCAVHLIRSFGSRDRSVDVASVGVDSTRLQVHKTDDQLELLRTEVLRLAKLPKTLHANRNISIGVGRGQSMRIGAPDWAVETKSTLRAIVRPDVVDEFDKVLRTKDEDDRRDAASAFLSGLAMRLSREHLL